MMKQGSAIELLRPDGNTVQTTLVTYGVPVWKDSDGGFLMVGDPKDPEFELTVGPDLGVEDVPAGTEVWLF